MVSYFENVQCEPFTIAVDDAVLDDLGERIRRSRWPGHLAGTGWDGGVDVGYLRDLLATWAGDFDWRARERALNTFAPFRAPVDGLWGRFIHARGHAPDPLPSPLPHARPHPLGLWGGRSRDGLGYPGFGAHGSDIGAGVTSRLGLRHPGPVVGIHLSAMSLATPPQPWSEAEREYLAAVERWDRAEGAYSEIQATKPQTVACGLNDSPAGLAAWIIEKFRAWSDCGGDVESRFTREQLLTNLTIYWATQTIGSSVRLYYEHRHRGSALRPGDQIGVPAGFASFANEFVPARHPPPPLAERNFQVTRWTEMPRGGHFAALEEPRLLAEDIRAFFRLLP